MTDTQPVLPRKTPWLTILVGAGLLAAGISTSVFLTLQPASKSPYAENETYEQSRQLAGQIKEVCSACHVYPSPKNLPRWAWKAAIDQSYEFMADPASVKANF